uniref:DUF86 domain-containing protein n=1 Tax=Candidatus Kentrum eta TaxID=2126337 RepID=A0A450VRX1_9GAMM|nr:MAG: hypothetical protein BECKH772C_GA0070978_104281 [Candidatus Kentron sp. H]
MDAEAWIAARELRNRLIHEYATSMERLADDIRAAGDFIPMFRQSHAAFLALAGTRFGVSESALERYLSPRA